MFVTIKKINSYNHEHIRVKSSGSLTAREHIQMCPYYVPKMHTNSIVHARAQVWIHLEIVWFQIGVRPVIVFISDNNNTTLKKLELILMLMLIATKKSAFSQRHRNLKIKS